jgi:hypothetical protein
VAPVRRSINKRDKKSCTLDCKTDRDVFEIKDKFLQENYMIDFKTPQSQKQGIFSKFYLILRKFFNYLGN